MQLQKINDFKSIHNAALIGFDELFSKLRELEKPQTGFPPYDIIKESEENFVIKLAVAGYKKDHINVTLDSGKLLVTGTQEKTDAKTYMYKGIAERDFSRTFTLSDRVEVDRVSLVDGMLYIYLQNIIPKEKPKQFQIE